MQLIQFFEYFYNWPNQYEHPKVSKIGSRGNRSPDVPESTKKFRLRARPKNIVNSSHVISDWPKSNKNKTWTRLKNGLNFLQDFLKGVRF